METQSTEIALGTKATHFRLEDRSSNNHYSYAELKGEKGTLVVFMCNHCPYVKHILPELLMIIADYRVMGLGIITISSNDAAKYPQDGPTQMSEFAFRHSFDFPYMYDESQDVARDYGATCTPDIFLFDAQDRLFYHGQIDDSRPGNGIPLSGSDLRSAIDALLFNRNLVSPQKASVGCNIKWK